MKNILALILLLTGVSLMTSGCGGDSKDENSGFDNSKPVPAED